MGRLIDADHFKKRMLDGGEVAEGYMSPETACVYREFLDGLAEDIDAEPTVSVEDAKAKKRCGDCYRFEPRDREGHIGFHCCKQDWKIDVFPDQEACEDYWDWLEEMRKKRLSGQTRELRRMKKWAKNASNLPVKLKLESDGDGVAPICPNCREMPYSKTQCHWCGQKFLLDEETEEWFTPKYTEVICPNCHSPQRARVSRYNGHKSFRCRKCGVSYME